MPRFASVSTVFACRSSVTSLGYHVTLASSGATRWSTRRGLNAIVLDVHLPDIDGLALLRELRRRRPGHGPPVVLFTADWEVEEHADEARALGATIVSKVCDLEEVERTIESLSATLSTSAE